MGGLLLSWLCSTLMWARQGFSRLAGVSKGELVETEYTYASTKSMPSVVASRSPRSVVAVERGVSVDLDGDEGLKLFGACTYQLVDMPPTCIGNNQPGRLSAKPIRSCS
jgi:hypothetical protein